MIKRRSAIYNGQVIGIESIYTIGPDGKHINIKDKVEYIRRLGQNKQLFCPCGCGCNVMLVAGDTGLRAQHFRTFGDMEDSCDLSNSEEGEVSYTSKVLLKLFLDDKLADNQLQLRVPINNISDSNRKYELSFLSNKYKLAFSYIHNRNNINDEKMNILKEYFNDIKIYYLVDKSNIITNGQYPEYMIKIQQYQGYCLFLQLGNSNDLYNTSYLIVSIYQQDIDGLWQYIQVNKDLLKNYNILLPDRQLQLNNGVLITDLVNKEIDNFNNLQQQTKIIRQERNRKEEQDKIKADKLKQQLEQEVLLKKQRIQEQCKKDELEQQELYNSIHKKITCIYCGQTKEVGDFSSYGGKGELQDKGQCWSCSQQGNNIPLEQYKHLLLLKATKPQSSPNTIPDNPYICPVCHGKLVLRYGPYGQFYGCSNYPRCKYSIKKI